MKNSIFLLMIGMVLLTCNSSSYMESNQPFEVKNPLHKAQFSNILKTNEYANAFNKVVFKGLQKKVNRLVKQKQSTPYSVIRKENINNVSFVNLSDKGNDIQLAFQENGSDVKSSVHNLSLSGSSGSSNNNLNADVVGFTNVTFPFKGSLDYYIPNQNHSDLIEGHLTFTINKPGTWEIILSN
ncbi:MAG TPA: hypothetical protein VKA34_10680 [Balneolales bacterium]|nr:hypothetical protein [Balneolales bacterium]